MFVCSFISLLFTYLCTVDYVSFICTYLVFIYPLICQFIICLFGCSCIHLCLQFVNSLIYVNVLLHTGVYIHVYVFVFVSHQYVKYARLHRPVYVYDLLLFY